MTAKWQREGILGGNGPLLYLDYGDSYIIAYDFKT